MSPVIILNWLEIYQETLHKKWSFPIKDFFSKCEQIRRKLK